MRPDQDQPCRISVLVLALAGLAACAGPIRGDGVPSPNHFDALDLARRPASSQVQQSRAALAPTDSQARPLSKRDAGARLLAYLSDAGFQPYAETFSGGLRITGALMADASSADHFDLDGECPLKALERPKMSTTEVEATLTPVGAPDKTPTDAVQLAVMVRTIELDANLVSGALSKRVCPSRGVLEGALRRAASGG